jgi:hypothetical protein
MRSGNWLVGCDRSSGWGWPQRDRFLSLRGAKRRGNLHRSARRDGDCFAPLAMTAGAPNLVHPIAPVERIDFLSVWSFIWV